VSEFRVPRASSARFNSLPTKEDKEKFISSYKAWKNNPFTKELIVLLENDLDKEVEAEESKSDFLSRFQFTFSSALSRGKRSVLRKLLKTI
jgi:hypothetical protein